MVAGVSSQEKELHINVLEMRAVQHTLNTFLPRIIGELVILMSNGTTVVVYLKKQAGTISQVIFFFFFFFFFFVKLLGGYVDSVTDWCVTGPGFAPRRVQL